MANVQKQVVNRVVSKLTALRMTLNDEERIVLDSIVVSSPDEVVAHRYIKANEGEEDEVVAHRFIKAEEGEDERKVSKVIFRVVMNDDQEYRIL